MNSSPAPAVGQIPLATDAVHVWRAPLRWTPECGHLEQLLSVDELRRAYKYRFAKDRCEFLITRAAIKDILSRYLDSQPSELVIASDVRGKPSLTGCEWLQFSISHSRTLALFAIARSKRVGIDVEMVRGDLPELQLADMFFAATEAELLRRLDGRSRSELFFILWTRKEAYLKARGEGIARRLRECDTSLASPSQPAFISENGCEWAIRPVKLGSHWIGACAAEGRAWRMCFWDWTLGARQLIPTSALS
jgi:4'-phosphopantetheinyl transferase